MNGTTSGNGNSNGAVTAATPHAASSVGVSPPASPSLSSPRTAIPLGNNNTSSNGNGNGNNGIGAGVGTMLSMLLGNSDRESRAARDAEKKEQEALAVETTLRAIQCMLQVQQEVRAHFISHITSPSFHMMWYVFYVVYDMIWYDMIWCALWWCNHK
jgi:hypothetical protein